MKQGGGSIKVCGCFSYNGVGYLNWNKGTLAEQKYHSILQRHAILSGITLHGHGNIHITYYYQMIWGAKPQNNDPKPDLISVQKTKKERTKR